MTTYGIKSLSRYGYAQIDKDYTNFVSYTSGSQSLSSNRLYTPVSFGSTIPPVIFSTKIQENNWIIPGEARRTSSTECNSAIIIHPWGDASGYDAVDWQTGYLSGISNYTLGDYGITIYNDEKRIIGNLTEMHPFLKIVRSVEVYNPMDAYSGGAAPPTAYYYAEDTYNNYFALSPFSWLNTGGPGMIGINLRIFGVLMTIENTNTIAIAVRGMLTVPSGLGDYAKHANFGPLHLTEFRPLN